MNSFILKKEKINMIDYIRNSFQWERVNDKWRTQMNQHLWDIYEYDKRELYQCGFSLFQENDLWFLVFDKAKQKQFEIIHEVPIYKNEIPQKALTIKSTNCLYDYQIPHATSLVNILLHKKSVIDASECGLGKTYTALAACRELGLTPLIVCPKTIIKSWQEAAKIFNIKVEVYSYEKLQYGNTEYLSVKSKRVNDFIWKRIPDIIIWDEFHKTKNFNTGNAKIARAAARQGIKAIMMSATIAETPIHLMTAVTMFDIAQKVAEVNKWAISHGCSFNKFHQMVFNTHPKNILKLHNEFFPNYAVRMTRKEAGDKFKKSLIQVNLYNLDDKSTKQLNSIYEKMDNELKQLDKTKKKDKKIECPYCEGTGIGCKKCDNTGMVISSHLTIMLRARQEAEIIKVPLFIELINEYIEKNLSVVVFVNFKQTIRALSERLNTKCIVEGGQSIKTRQQMINDFQSDKERIILVNTQAGGVGTSLHDLNNKHQRVALISPTNSAVNFTQVLGRIDRANSKSDAIQNIIYIADTVEEQTYLTVKSKINNIAKINSGDLKFKFDTKK